MTKQTKAVLKTSSGQASIELLLMVPLVLVFSWVLVEAVLVGQAVWSGGAAARAAARAAAVGGDQKAIKLAARREIPGLMVSALSVKKVSAKTGDQFEVTITVPLLPTGKQLLKLRSAAAFEPQV